MSQRQPPREYSSYPSRNPDPGTQLPPPPPPPPLPNLVPPPSVPRNLINVPPPPPPPLHVPSHQQRGNMPRSGASQYSGYDSPPTGPIIRRNRVHRQRETQSRTYYSPPKDEASRLRNEVAQLREEIAKRDAIDKEDWYFQSSYASLGPSNRDSTSSDDDGGANIRKIKRAQTVAEFVQNKHEHKRSKKDKKNKRRRSSSSSDSERRSKKSKLPGSVKYEFLSTNVSLDRHVHPNFIILDTNPKPKTNFDVLTNRLSQLSFTPPERIDHKFLEYEYTESAYEECNLNEHTTDGKLQFNRPFDPQDPQGRFAFIPEKTNHIDWATVSYSDYQSMNHLLRSTFHQSDPEKKAMFFKTVLITCQNDNAPVWIELVKLEPEIHESRQRKGLQTGEVDIIALQLQKLEQAKSTCHDKVDLELYELELLTQQGKLNDDELESRWNGVINRYMNNLTVWRQKIATYKTSSRHTVDKILKLCYFRCLKKLGGLIDGSIKSHKKLPGTEEFVLEVLQSAVALLIESGYVHKAVALLQAYVEFYFFSPQRLTVFSEKLKYFNYFWESPIQKVGVSSARTWIGCDASNDMKNFTFNENGLISVGSELHELSSSFNTVLKEVLNSPEAIHLPRSVLWARGEAARSNVAWKPTVNKLQNSGSYFEPMHVSFDEISDVFINFPDNETPLKAVFMMMVQLGAVIPDVQNLSSMNLFDFPMEKLHVFEFKHVDAFLDDILLRLSSLTPGLFLRCMVARLLTYASFVEAKAPDLKTAVNQIWTQMLNLRRNSRNLTSSEQKTMIAYFQEIESRLFKRFNTPNENTQKLTQIMFSIKIFNDDIIASELLNILRFAVTLCRNSPYSEAPTKHENSKLAVIIEMSSKSLRDPTDLSELRNLWVNAHTSCIEKSKLIPTDYLWIGNIENLFTELLALVLYETEADSENKWIAFSACFSSEMLQSNEYLIEVYFTTWLNHAIRYNAPKGELMAQLNESLNRFPLNVALMRILAQCLPIDEARSYFANDSITQHSSSVLNDRVRILRAVVQFTPIMKLWWEHRHYDEQDDVNRNQHFIELLRETAISLSQTSMQPDTFLWRLLIHTQVCLQKRAEDMERVFIEARQHCLWSKAFLIFFHLYTHTAFLESSVNEAVENGLKINFALHESHGR